MKTGETPNGVPDEEPMMDPQTPNGVPDDEDDYEEDVPTAKPTGGFTGEEVGSELLKEVRTEGFDYLWTNKMINQLVKTSPIDSC
jgi:hypothetical protein